MWWGENERKREKELAIPASAEHEEGMRPGWHIGDGEPVHVPKDAPANWRLVLRSDI